ncbi:D-lactate ferricytochrome c oxidoreductase [Dimargaris cristalligena]|nr:D-lactate ferricytochrome c oxidoreductase [Dimargaris cristalligena]
MSFLSSALCLRSLPLTRPALALALAQSACRWSVRPTPGPPFCRLPSIRSISTYPPSWAAALLKRNPQFKSLDWTDVQAFRTILPSPGGVLTSIRDPTNPDATTSSSSSASVSADQLDSQEALQAYNTDWLKLYRGQAPVVLFPETTAHVAAILRYCQEHRLAVVPQGGNTCVTGASVPVFDELILNLAKLNRVRQFDPVGGVLVSDAGCILQNLEAYVEPRGFTMPLDLAAKGSCQIGGNVATNAGGVHFLKYGSLHGSVLGLEVVLPSGEVMDLLSTLRKDSTGYDLKQLFIGAEGTLGVITGVALQTAPFLPSKVAVLLGLNSYKQALDTYALAQKHIYQNLSAFEFWDRECFNYLLESGANAPSEPFASTYPYYILVESSSSDEDQNQESLSKFLDILLQNKLMGDGTISFDQSQFNRLWAYRESIPSAVLRHPSLAYDLTLDYPHFYQVVEVLRDRLRQMGLYDGYKGRGNVQAIAGLGHFGDAKDLNKEVFEAVEPFIYEWAAERGGSISAEHGLGILKAPYLHYTRSEVVIRTMRQIKTVFDPHGIMNPYKVLT